MEKENGKKSSSLWLSRETIKKTFPLVGQQKMSRKWMTTSLKEKVFSPFVNLYQ